MDAAARRDAELVARAQKGDQAAFTELVRIHQDRVYAVARGIVRHPDDAADVMQEAFISVLRALPQFQGTSRFSTWLHRIVVRKAYDHLRKRVPAPLDPQSQTITDRSDGGSAHEQNLARQDLLQCLNELDQGFRDAVLLVDVAGLSVEEAAQILEVAPGTIKSRVFRARALLARNLGTRGYGAASNG